MQKTCAHCKSVFDVDAQQLQFLEKASIKIAGKPLRIPPPLNCPDCRLQRRLSHRNENQVVQVPSASTGKMIFSMYSGDIRFPVISNEEWYGDGWNPLDYGKEIDFSRPFFDQWRELRDSVPRPAICGDMLENSAYCNNAGFLKDCYFAFDADHCRECYYVETAIKSVDCIDCSQISECQICYDCVGCVRCYNLQSSDGSVDCSDSLYLKNCRSCKNCIGCVNLRQKEYCIFNKQHSATEYKEFLNTLSLSSHGFRNELKNKFDRLCEEHPHPHILGSRLHNCSGNHIHSSKNVEESFFVYGAEDVRFGFILSLNARNCQDYTVWGEGAELIYESCVCGRNIFNLLFCMNCWDGCSNLIYCDYCLGSSNCFGCIAVRKKEHCILNTSYTKSEYDRLVPRLVEHMRETGEWGEFFPMQISAHPYNTTLAQRYFPLKQSECSDLGLGWLPEASPKDIQAHQIKELKDEIPDTDESIIVKSQSSSRIFKITSQEIKRLRSFNAPLPRDAYDERMESRAKRLGSIFLQSRSCSKTGQTITSVYSKDSAFPVWNKEDFDKEFD